jgi:hypothetical protein
MKRFTYYGSLQSASPLLADLVAWYDFNNNVLDATPNAYNGTEVGSPSYVTGIIGNAINFQNDATLRYVTVPDNDDFSFTNGVTDLPFSISFFAQNLAISSIGNWYFSKRGAGIGQAEYQIFWSASTNTLVVNLSSNGDINNRITCTSTVNPFGLSTWAHIVVTYSGSGLASGLKIYVNGVDVTSTTSTVGTYVGMINTTAIIGIGQALFSLINSLKHRGYMDLLGVWKNRELTLAEVNQLYNSGAGITYPF